MKRRSAVIVIVVAAVAAAIYFVFDPSESGLFPKCVFRSLTGLKCAGCGTQRAVHSMLHLDFIAAAKYNFLSVAALPAVAVLLLAEIKRRTFPHLYSAIQKPAAIWTVFAVIVVWTVVRNVFGW